MVVALAMKTRQDVMTWAEREPTLDPQRIQLLRIAVAALIFNGDGRILLHCRGSTARDAVDCLEGIGGGLDENEDLLQSAVAREISEEIGEGCRFSGCEFLVCSHLQFESKGTLKDWAVVTFMCELTGGQPVVREPGQTTGLGWFELSELASWKPDERRRVALVDQEGNTFEREVGLSIWVPTVVQEYLQRYGTKPWRGSRKRK